MLVIYIFKFVPRGCSNYTGRYCNQRTYLKSIPKLNCYWHCLNIVRCLLLTQLHSTYSVTPVSTLHQTRGFMEWTCFLRLAPFVFVSELLALNSLATDYRILLQCSIFSQSFSVLTVFHIISALSYRVIMFL